MRLTQAQRETVLSSVHELAGKATQVRVFGSRLDDSRRGGDLDLLLISEVPIPLLIRAELKQTLEARLQLPVDIVNYARDAEPTPFQAIAMHQSLALDIEDAA